MIRGVKESQRTKVEGNLGTMVEEVGYSYIWQKNCMCFWNKHPGLFKANYPGKKGLDFTIYNI